MRQAGTATQHAGKPDHNRNQTYQSDDNLGELENIGVDRNAKPTLHHPEDDVGDQKNDRDVAQQIKESEITDGHETFSL